MKITNKIISGISALSILLTLFISTLSPIAAYAEGEVVLIESAEDLIEFSNNCSYDLWSLGKSFLLTKDISLEGFEFEPIPSFCGSFDGGGHTISGLSLSGAYSPLGLFCSLEKDGVVKNLTVKAAVAAEGDGNCVGGIVGDNSGIIENCIFIGTVIGSSDVGGIVGRNRVSGSVKGCTAGGEVIGENRSGGIAGSNEGLVSSSTSSAKVNTVSITPSLSLDELNVSLTLDITKLPTLTSISVSDTGGIAGYSTGMIMGCVNNGRVGYPHVGYNVGGIAGRSSGHITGCINNAEVFGRKDVGGIAGQMEPYVNYELSEDLLSALKTELDELSLVVAEAAGKAEGEIPTVSGRFDSIIGNLDDATDSLNTLIGNITDYGDGLTGEVNRVGEILTEALSQITNITKELPALSGLLGDGLEDFEAALNGLDEFFLLGAQAIGDMILLAQDTSSAFETIGLSLERLEAGAAALEAALIIKDKAAAEASFDTICDGLGDATKAADSLAAAFKAVTEVLGDTAWADDAIEQIGELTQVFSELSGAVSDIYDATVEIEENIDIYWSEIETAGQSLVTAVGYFTNTMTELNSALDLMESGLGKITEGMEGILESVSVNDIEATRLAAEKIVLGAEELVNAAVRAGEAFKKLSESLKSLDADGELSEIFGDVTDSMGDISESGGESLKAISKLAEGLKVIFDNVTIDFDLITQSGSLIVGGVGDMTEALRRMREAIGSLGDGMTALDGAINSISRAVVIKDKEQLESSLQSASAAVGTIISAVAETSAILTKSAETMKEAKIWGDELTEAVSKLCGTLSSITDAILKVQGGFDLLRENIDFDLDSAEGGISLIIEGIGDMADAAEYVKSALLHLSDSLTDIEGAADGMVNIIIDLTSSVSHFTDAMNSITGMAENIHTLMEYLGGIDPIQLPKPSDSITSTANQLFISISAIERELGYLNSDITSLSSDVVQRIARINKIFNEMSSNIVDIIYGLNDGSIIDDKVDESDISSITGGKLFSCTNNGKVEGDINVGGISGVMGLEYSLDPEDDLSVEMSVTQKKQYQLKAVIHACTNNGDVISKYDSAGGICGKMDFGLIYGCESYCRVESTAGDYVGGIAGISAGQISASFAKCALAGGKYVGGILGSGVREDYSGDSSIVRGCYSMVEIARARQYFGAVAGANVGEYEENLFVSNDLSGIDRVSYHGKAEPISYEDLVKRRSIPEEFYSLTLEFVADGEPLYSTKFEYGASFDASVFPDIPKKEGHYGVWDRTELRDIVFDTTVSVIYKAYTTALGSSEERDGREIFLVQGEFTDGDSISLAEGANTSKLHTESSFFTRDTLVESWILTIPADGLDMNRVHFLSPDGSCKIFIKLDGTWTQVAAEEFGSYLCFDVSGEQVEIAVVRQTLRILPIAIIGGALIICAAIAVILIRKMKKAKKADGIIAESQKEKATV